MNWIIAIIALNFIVLVHELGHFLVAKFSGIGVNEFSLFMGPKIYGIKKGETTFSIRSIPIGAFVALEGEENSSANNRSFSNKPLPIRAAVIAAGPLMNLLVAVIFITIVFSLVGFETTKIKSVVKNSPASVAGIRAGDEVIRYDGKRVFQLLDVSTFMYVSKGKTAVVKIKRGKDFKTLLISPQKIPGNRYILGFISQEAEGENSNVVKSIVKDSPAETSGIKPGDRIIKLNDNTILSKEAISNYLSGNKNKPVQVTVLRNSATVNLQVIPRLEKGPEQYFVGVIFKTERDNIFGTIKQSIIYTGANIIGVVRTLAWLVTGKMSVKLIAGPVGIVSTISDVVGQSPTLWTIIINLLNICAFISIALGATNLIPFPALDGARLLVISIGMIRGKEIIAPEKEATISMVGFMILVSFGIFLIINDFIRLIWS